MRKLGIILIAILILFTATNLNILFIHTNAEEIVDIPELTFTGHNDDVHSVAWSPNGDKIASVGSYNFGVIWQ